MSKLTIGMCVYDDIDGAYFTVQSIRAFHREVIKDIEFVIINNNPSSAAGILTKKFFTEDQITEPVKYAEFDKYAGTGIRDLIFTIADTPYVLVIDCHVLLLPGTLKKLIDFYDQGLDEGNLLQGPLIHDTLTQANTHFIREWNNSMYGRWSPTINIEELPLEPFEIEGQGLGLFSCRKDSWVGINPNFRGFGAEEIYLNDKFKKNGKKTLCVPFLQWVHRFPRVTVPYPNSYLDRYKNYLFARVELNQEIDDVEEEYKKFISEEERNQARAYVIETLKSPKKGCGCKEKKQIKADPS